MRIFIAGAGEVGTHLAKMFCSASHDVILMDNDGERLKLLDSHFDLMTIVGNMTSLEDLKEAEVKMSDLFISVSPLQDMNILAAILAKKLGARITVARVDNPEFLLPENKEFFRQLGVEELIYPEELAAADVVTSLKQVGIRQMYEFSGGKLLLVGLKLRNTSTLASQSLTDTELMHHDRLYNTVAVNRDGVTIVPRGNDRFQHNDLVYFVTTRQGLSFLLDDGGKKQVDIKHVMILGGSRIGKKVAKAIEGQYHVKLVEINKEKSQQLADYLVDTLVINGDGRNLELLKDEGIEQMDAFIAVTGNSEVNILACQLAKRLGVKKTVAEVENLDYISLAENIGIGTIVNKKLIAASYIYRHTLKSQTSYVKCLTSTDGEVIELIAQEGAKITSAPLGQLHLPQEMAIGGIVREDEAIIATPHTQVMSGDKVVMFALTSAISKVEKLFID
jgi:trk system potassium uptake protein TrkA